MSTDVTVNFDALSALSSNPAFWDLIKGQVQEWIQGLAPTVKAYDLLNDDQRAIAEAAPSFINSDVPLSQFFGDPPGSAQLTQLSNIIVTAQQYITEGDRVGTVFSYTDPGGDATKNQTAVRINDNGIPRWQISGVNGFVGTTNIPTYDSVAGWTRLTPE